MHITYFSASIIPSSYANSVHVMKMCDAFASNGHSVTLIATQGGNKEIGQVYQDYGVSDGFRLIRLNRPGLGRFGSLIYGLKSSNIAKTTKAELYYGRCPHSLFWASGYGIPFIYEAHNIPSGKIRKLLEKRLFTRSSFRRLVVITKELKKEYLKMFPEILESMVTVAHDAASDVTESMQSPKKSRKLLKVGYAGSLYPGKGMEIVAELAKCLPEKEFHVIGANGPIEEWRARLHGNIVFHGQVAPSKVGEMLSAFDVLLLPMLKKVETDGGGDIGRYTSPLKLFEYMAANRPIVASRLPVIEEVLVHNQDAILANPENTDSWLQALMQLEDNQDLRERLARNAFTKFRAKYTWEKRAEAVLSGALDA